MCLENFYDSYKELGVQFPFDGADGDAIGYLWAPDVLDPILERRSSARTAYYDSSKARRNLHLLTGTQVTRLITKLTPSGLSVTDVEVPHPTSPLLVGTFVTKARFSSPQARMRRGRQFLSKRRQFCLQEEYVHHTSYSFLE